MTRANSTSFRSRVALVTALLACLAVLAGLPGCLPGCLAGCLAGCAGRQGAPLAVTQGSVQADGVSLDYSLAGKGRPLLMLTGYAVERGMWDAAFIRKLSQGRTLILMDNRGMGESGLDGAREITIAGMAADAAALLDALGVAKADVLGWSMGGMVAQELALSRPDKVCSLVLVASASEIGPVVPALDRLNSMSPGELRAAMFPPDFAAAHPEVFRRIVPRSHPLDISVVKRQYRAMLDWPGTEGRLGGLRAPVLLLAGDKDDVCPVALSRRFLALLPGGGVGSGKLRLIENGSHWMMHQFPEKLAAVVAAFVRDAGCARTRPIAPQSHPPPPWAGGSSPVGARTDPR